MNSKNEWWKNPALASFFQQPDNTNNELSGRYGFTGRGADGIAQPDRRVPGAGNGSYDAHESEFIFDANTTQAIGPDVLSGIQAAAKQGTIDLNKLREAIGQPGRQSYQIGGLTQPKNGKNLNTTAINVPSTNKINTIGENRPVNPDVQIPDTTVNKLQKVKGPVIQENTIPNKLISPPRPAPVIGENITNKNVSPSITQKNKLETIGHTPFTFGKTERPTPEFARKIPGSTIPGMQQGIQQLSQNTVDKIEQQNIPMDEVMKYMQGIMTGDNPYFQQIKNLVAQDIGGAGAAATAAIKAEARQRGVSEEAVGSMGLTRQRDVEAIGSRALGELAVEQGKMGMQAAGELFGMQMDKAQFDFAKEKYGDEEGQRIAADINAGMTYDQIKAKYPNVTEADYNSMKSFSTMGFAQKQFDFAKQQYGDLEGQRIAADINSGMTYDQIKAKYPNVTEADYNGMKAFSAMGFAQKQYQDQFDFMKQKYGDLEGGRIAQDITNGMTWDQIKEKYPDMTYEDYKSMKDASPLGQLNWQREMDAINMLISAGGQQNFDNAASMLNNMFPGLDIDFSNALNAENAQKFSQGMGNIANYIASGMDWDTALKAMNKDGTFDLLNMTESDVEAMYNRLNLAQNPIIQAEDTYQQLLDQGIITKDQYDDLMAIITWGITNPQGIEISDGFMLTDKKGNEVGFFKTQKEMEEWMTNNPGDYQVSNVKNHISIAGETTTGTTTTGTTTGETGEEIPAGVEIGDIYEKDGILYKNTEAGTEEILDSDYDAENTAEGDLFMVGEDLYIKEKNKSTKINKNDVLNDVWGDNSQKIVDYESELYDKNPLKDMILNQRVKDVIEGKKDTKGLDNQTFIALLESSSAPAMVNYEPLKDGKMTEVVDDGFNTSGKKKRRVVSQFENLKDGDLITINKNGNPTVFKFSSKNRSKQAGYDRTIYTFVNAQTGEKMQVVANKEMGIRTFNQSDYYGTEGFTVTGITD